MKRVLLLLFSIYCFSFTCYSQSEESNRLFAEGVDLYNTGKYKEAIDVFGKADSLDRAEMDTTAVRFGYTTHYLAYCNFLLGNIDEAKRHSPLFHSLEPVNRALTVECDAYWQSAKDCAEAGQLSQAEENMAKCIAIQKEVLGPHHCYIALAHNKMASIYIRNNMVDKSISELDLALECLAHHKEVAPSLYYDYICSKGSILVGNYHLLPKDKVATFMQEYYSAFNSLYKNGLYNDELYAWHCTYYINLAQNYGQIGKELLFRQVDEAEIYFARSAELMRKLGYTQGQAYINLMRDYARLYLKTAIDRYEGKMNALADEFAANPNVSSLIYTYMSSDYFDIGMYQKATQYAEKALKVIEDQPESEYRELDAKVCLAKCCQKTGNDHKVIELMEDVCSKYLQMKNSRDLTYALFLDILVNSYKDLENREKAIQLLNESMQIRRDGSQSSREYSIWLIYSASSMSQLGMHEFAHKILDEAAEIIGRDFGFDNEEGYLLATYSVALKYNEDKYEEMLADIDSIYAKYGGKDFFSETTDYNLLKMKSKAYEALNQPGLAVETIKRIIEIEKAKPTPSLQTLLNCAKSLRNIYGMMGDYSQKEYYFNYIKELTESSMGELSPSTAVEISLYEIDNLTDHRRYDEAIKLVQEQLEKLKSIQIRDNEGYEMVFKLYIAKIYMLQGRFNEAQPLFIDLAESTMANNVLIKMFAQLCKVLSSVYNGERDNYKEAMVQIEVLQSITASNYWMNKIADLLKIEVYRRSGIDDNSSAEIVEMATQQRNDLLDNFATMTSRERFVFWNRIEFIFTSLIPRVCAAKPDDKTLLSFAYNTSLFSHGILLEADRNIADMIAARGSQDLKELYARFTKDKARLNQLNNNMASIIDETERNTASSQLQSLAEQLEKDERVVNESVTRELVDFMQPLRVEWTDVRRNLKKGEIAIELLEYRFADKTYYAAMTLAKDYDCPHFIPLFERKSDDSSYADDCYSTTTLSENIWGKLGDELKGISTVYFASQGSLNSIALESLPRLDAEGPVSSDGRHYYRLSSTREIVFAGKKQNHHLSAVIYGGLDYDMDLDDMRLANVNVKKTSSSEDSRLRGIGSIEYLPGSLEEAEAIAAVLNDNRVGNTDLLLGDKGTEPSFKALSGQGKSIIHIATHGYYVGDNSQKEKDLLAEMMPSILSASNNLDTRSEEDQMLQRSGLIMAGATNKLLYGNEFPDDIDDGMLSAEEISTLDFNGLDLVTLSACDTGRGDITGDGVFGLQRGFKKAGAKSIMMSLWKVDDNATQLLMTEFYSNWLQKHQSKYDAFENAKIKVRSIYPAPEYWAAFILLDALD